ncbi:Wzz/FepE/Etk N-terminal domain-containing protein [Halorhodospira halochloris]|uniref:Wzz/FepE/Etk N-terminal domain-containing protein n=1 Tax=Halorhodospira halochloris TaxID=1052 RepID=UPI001EE96619|nr:Wzz/FepE/Etk N-terminal domain-containing protein [Halorhodospira halochloris]MCG5549110.1 Wzz/FepE/Etk N-terminal domain-containing protein [Halorhodospira halochloris]
MEQHHSMEGRELQPRQQPNQPGDDEIDLVDLIRTLWSWKWVIILSTMIGTLGAGAYGYVQPTEYRAEALVSPTQDRGGGGLGGNIGGLAGMAGIDIDEGVAVTDRALALMRSRRFLQPLIEEAELLPYLFPEHWDEEEGAWKEEIWRVKERSWQEEDEQWRDGDKIKLPHPLPRHGVGRLRSAIDHSEDDGGLMKIAVVWEDREVAANLANLLVERTNAVMREEEINRLDRRLNHLREQVSNTTISGVREALYNIMESNYKSQAVAQTEREYIFSIIDPALPDDASTAGFGTRIYAALGMILGGMLGVFAAFVGEFVRNNLLPKKANSQQGQ